MVGACVRGTGAVFASRAPVRYLVLATDYDGTIAHDGVVSAATIAAIERFRATGGRPIMVTGRELPDLERAFARFDLFDRIVAENGGVLYNPATKRERVLCAPSSPALVNALRVRGVPLSVGRAVVATVEPHQLAVLNAIRELGLELQVIFNKGAVMVLPSGVNKATGLLATLEDLCVSPHDVVGVGDAENDHAFLDICELSVAVRNAVPALRERVDLVTQGARGDGVQELIDRLLATGPDAAPSPQRHWLAIGSAQNRAVTIDPHGPNILITGASDAGASPLVTLTTTLLEQLAEQRYQFCLVDSKGSYESFLRAIRVGTLQTALDIDEVIGALQRPDQNVIASLAGVPAVGRPRCFASLLPRIRELRAKTGHPHWTVLDGAHHLLPSDATDPATAAAGSWGKVVMVTAAPDLISAQAIDQVEVFIAVGEVTDPLSAILTRRGLRASPGKIDPGLAMMWRAGDSADPIAFTVKPPDEDHRRPA
jgi:hydroxymethylpyrimidine pyrophosphatase-like HAD family hydrolase